MDAFNPKKLALASGLTATLLGAFLLGGAAIRGVSAAPLATADMSTLAAQATASEQPEAKGTPEASEQPEAKEAPEAAEQPVDPAQAKITLDQAKQAALAKFPGGTVVSATLENEHGTLVWDVELTDANGASQEVAVDATSGQIVSAHAGETEGTNDTEGPEQPGTDD